MAKVRLRSTIFVDLPMGGDITAFHFHRALMGRINLSDQESNINFWLKRSVTSKINILEYPGSLDGTTLRALASNIETDLGTDAEVIALRRSNLPVPPQGKLWLLSSQGETALQHGSLRRGDTQVIRLIAHGSFPSTPNIVFAVKDSLDPCVEPLIIKENISVLSIEDVQDCNGIAQQKLHAQIVIFPGETAKINQTKTLFYTCEIIDVQADETYTLETGNFTVKADVHNFFGGN